MFQCQSTTSSAVRVTFTELLTSKETAMADNAQAKKPAAKKSAAAKTRRVAVIGGNRIPFARSNTVYIDVSNQEMLTAAVDGLVDRFGLAGERVGEFAAGAVLKHSRDFNLARETVLGSKLDPSTPAFDVQQACDTGIQAAILVANKIALGKIESGIAGGSDTTSDAPLAVGDKLRRILLEANRAKDNKGRLAAIAKIRPSLFAPDQPRNAEPRTGLSMGDSQAITTKEWGITREEQDQLAVNSHHNLAASYDEGWQDDLVTPFRGVEKDNNMRADSSMEKLAKLKPVFGKSFGDEATMTAANSTPLSDGASAVLLASEEEAERRGWHVQAYFADYETAAVDYVSGAEGLLMAPVYAVPRMLERQGLTLQDFDFYEIHEAFAGQVLTTLAAWEDADFCKNKLGLDAPLGAIDRSKLNVKGSSLAAAHPFAATGGRIIANLAKLLDQKGSGRGLISICAAGGQGVVAILEK
jgi:acetyl-CoA C-acetyltransferase